MQKDSPTLCFHLPVEAINFFRWTNVDQKLDCTSYLATVDMRNFQVVPSNLSNNSLNFRGIFLEEYFDS